MSERGIDDAQMVKDLGERICPDLCEMRTPGNAKQPDGPPVHHHESCNFKPGHEGPHSYMGPLGYDIYAGEWDDTDQ